LKMGEEWGHSCKWLMPVYNSPDSILSFGPYEVTSLVTELVNISKSGVLRAAA
jgi:hypothetical protein